ncbi:MAG: sensor histidine kinase [Chitinophagaceae bacterium]|nr:sensor histidine kinase [Chitinophagaceae bacterium]
MQALSKDIIITISLTLFVLTLTSFIVAFVVYHQRRQNKFLFEKTQLQQKFQQELLRTQLEIQEQTLQNISQEIHDNIGQTLSLAKLHLNTVDLQKQNAEEKITNSKEMVSKAIQDLRTLSQTLNTDTIVSAGLLKAIEFELQLLDKAGEFRTEFIVSGEPVKMDAKKELILFRIIQEAVNNVIKHSKATALTIRIKFTEDAVILSVEDNGTGFISTHNRDGANGSGLSNMRNRALIIGGSFDIETSSAGGTKISINVPITQS